ncbi:hypothetical protein SNK03_003775 [Fusarium graminearum]|uniref:Chromosome 1, complete genome n=2 Tax=Gibberella zeae TaxID=5518 RepID=I1S0Z1_GIBZE|nr:hypothetical protein FGSG_10383 [Fusarium graminearum PH-1]EYB31332.1 hypothetical protein FG05_10383 [Fusarium graminearum]ESU17090.1 hypothetical protein FGSG_10383 [Fusarium graminearum PH-1]KAI6759893.1 hypothetical protein HG531_013799 [Fusarium graminearum]PCD18650.1 hypothetical protein FGRA07_06403 [Fusarium graminearum]CAF3519651.1 unnamed protein product [Fusarium graminearum]|eukprot:XP_011319352.1 hypothetical protein FGSG_10383 [Fusarium graminearum PH-1]
MPVTNRGVTQLTPDTTSTASATSNYLNKSSPSLETLQAGLAIFAVAVIARFCVLQLYLWLRQMRGLDQQNLPARSILSSFSQPRRLLQSRPIWTMDEKDNTPLGHRQDIDVESGLQVSSAQRNLVIDPNWQSADNAMSRHILSRPPPAPPLTPPELSTAVFTFEDRPRPGDDSFIRQPNPDYMSSTADAVLPPNSGTASVTRRRSYNKTLPIGVPVSQSSQDISDAADLVLSPSSYPPTSPFLPPAPPNAGTTEIGVQGEIIGVLDNEGSGWTRHTRVYGGGVCLACAASGGNHGGGFYGATVRPEEMR